MKTYFVVAPFYFLKKNSIIIFTIAMEGGFTFGTYCLSPFCHMSHIFSEDIMTERGHSPPPPSHLKVPASIQSRPTRWNLWFWLKNRKLHYFNHIYEPWPQKAISITSYKYFQLGSVIWKGGSINCISLTHNISPFLLLINDISKSKF